MPVVNVYSTSVTSENISRHELLAWVNDCLQSKLIKIEEMATGAAYCHLTDFLFPTKVPLKKVKWNSRSDVDWMNNWRVLQQSWKTIGIDKPVPVQNLMRAKFQDNFEFLQWFKKFFDANYDGHQYDPSAARNYEEFPAVLPGGSKQKGPPPQPPPAATGRRAQSASTKPVSQPAGILSTPVPQNRAKTTKAVRPPVAQPVVGPSPAAPRRSILRTAATTQRPPSIVSRQQQQNGGVEAAVGGSGRAKGVAAKVPSSTPTAEMNSLKQQIQSLETLNSNINAQLRDERERAQLYERERNFYFDKLRCIEILCGSCAGVEGVGGVLRVDEVQAILWDRSEGTSSTDGRSSAQTRLSPQPRGDMPRLDSPDAEQMHAMAMQQNNTKFNRDSEGAQENASGSLDIAHLEDSFLMEGSANESAIMARRNRPIFDISDEKNDADEEVQRTRSEQRAEVEDEKVTKMEPLKDVVGAGHGDETYNVSSAEQRESNAMNRTHPADGDREKAGASLMMNATYPFQQNKDPSEADLTQTIENGPTLLNRTHPVAAMGDEPPKQQQHKQQEVPEADDTTPCAAAHVSDDSSLLMLDPSLTGACPMINIIDSPKLLDATETDKTGNLEVDAAQREQKESAFI